MTARPEVLFVCVHNAGRSQMAAALVTLRSGGRVRVRSAGSDPAAEVNPAVVEAMRDPGKRYEDWQVDDPAGADLDAVRRIRDEIDGRVRRLVDELLAGAGSREGQGRGGR